MHFSTSSILLYIVFNLSTFYELLIQDIGSSCSLPSFDYQVLQPLHLALFTLLLNLHSMYSILDLLNNKISDFRASPQISILTLTPLLVSSTKTILFAKAYTKGLSLDAGSFRIQHYTRFLEKFFKGSSCLRVSC